MAYLNLYPLVDTSIYCKSSTIQQKPKKLQMVNSSICLYKEKKPRNIFPELPEIVLPEKKQIHGKARILKTKTLPLIKNSDNENDKSFVNKTDFGSDEKNQSSRKGTKITKIVNISIKLTSGNSGTSKPLTPLVRESLKLCKSYLGFI